MVDSSFAQKVNATYTQYGEGTYSIFNVIENWGLGFHFGGAVKYIGRGHEGLNGHGSKDLDDIDKAIWYLGRWLDLPPATDPVKGPKGELVNHPQHYNPGTYEVINVLEAWRMGFHLGNALKYLARAEKKGSARQDVSKAIWYLKRYRESNLIVPSSGYAITINGRKEHVEDAKLEYSDILRFALIPIDRTATVIYRDGRHGDGSLSSDESVIVTDGTIINAAIT